MIIYKLHILYMIKLIVVMLLFSFPSDASQEVSKRDFLKLKIQLKKLEQELNMVKKKLPYSITKEKRNIYFKHPKKIDIKFMAALDKNFITNDQQSRADNSEFRYVRLSFRDKVNISDLDLYKLKFEVDFSGDKVKLEDIYVDISLKEELSLKIGQFKEYMSHAILTDPSDLPFLERPAMSGLLPVRNIGVAVTKNSRKYLVAGGLFGDASGDIQSSDETVSFTSKLIWLPYVKNKKVVHIGSSWRHSNPSGNRVSYDISEVSYASGVSDLVTSIINNVSEINQSNFEIIFFRPRVNIIMEHLKSDLTRKNMSKLEFVGSYIQLGMSLNKAVSRYSFKSKTVRDINIDIKNLWQLLYRHSDVDLNHQDFRKGHYKSSSIALAYYLSQNLKFIFSYVKVRTDEYSYSKNNSPDIISLRTKFVF